MVDPYKMARQASTNVQCILPCEVRYDIVFEGGCYEMEVLSND